MKGKWRKDKQNSRDDVVSNGEGRQTSAATHIILHKKNYNNYLFFTAFVVETNCIYTRFIPLKMH